MRKRRACNTKKRIQDTFPPMAYEELLRRARYGGNPEHKRNPGDFGLIPPSNPGPDKSLCDEAGIFSQSEAERLLREGIRRGLNTIHDFIPLEAFRRTVLTFADAVLERLRETGTTKSLLHDLRDDIREEESDPKSSQWRQIEALSGYDPDEAADATIEKVISESEKYGSASINELIAYSGREPDPVFRWLADSASTAGSPVIIPESAELRKKTARTDSSLLPWERAGIAARLAKAQWSLPENTISNRQLKEVFALKNGILKDHHGNAPISLAFRNGDSDSIQATLTSPHEYARRFALLRVVADHLYSPASDHLLPATKAKTARQQFQKAFAQECLCPSQELIAFMDDDFRDERLDDAASHFNVSSLVVKTTLVNKGLLGRYEIEDQWGR